MNETQYMYKLAACHADIQFSRLLKGWHRYRDYVYDTEMHRKILY